MARKATARIIDAFIARKCASDVRLFTDGTILRSYALLIAQWVPARKGKPAHVAILSDSVRKGCSATTRSHIDAVRDACRRFVMGAERPDGTRECGGYVDVIPTSDLPPEPGAYLGPKRGENAPRLS